MPLRGANAMASARASLQAPVATHPPLHAIPQSRLLSVTSVANLIGEPRKSNQQERAIRLREIEKRNRRQGQDVSSLVSQTASRIHRAHKGPTRPKDRPRSLDSDRTPRTDRTRRTAPTRPDAFATSVKLVRLRKSLSSDDAKPARVWQSAQEVYDAFPSSKRKDSVLLSNQMIDLALQCGKSKEARTIYLSIEKNGSCPNLATIGTVLVGILHKAPTEQDTQLRQWAHDCYQELEQLRMDAFSPPSTGDGTPFMRMRRRQASQDEASPPNRSREEILEEIRRCPWLLSIPYSTYVGCCISFGQDDRAWEIIQRGGTKLFHSRDGFPCLNWRFLNRWIINYSKKYGGRFLDIPAFAYKRTHSLLEQWWRALPGNMDTIQRQYEQALGQGDRSRAKDLLSAWKVMIPEQKDLPDFINAANFSNNDDFQRISLDVLTSFTTFDFGDSPPRPPAKLRQPFGKVARHDDVVKDDPLASVLPCTRADYFPSGEGEMSPLATRTAFDTAQALLSFNTSLRETAFEAAVSMILRIAQEELDYVRRRGLESRAAPPSPSGAPWLLPDSPSEEAAHESRLTRYRRLFDISNLWIRYLTAWPREDPKLSAKAMRVLSTVRELHQARLVTEGPDSRLYTAVLRGIPNADERNVQICKWWMEDNELSKLPTREQVEARRSTKRVLAKSRACQENPWTMEVISNSHKYALGVWHSAGVFLKTSTEQKILKGKGKSGKQIIAEQLMTAAEEEDLFEEEMIEEENEEAVGAMEPTEGKEENQSEGESSSSPSLTSSSSSPTPPSVKRRGPAPNQDVDASRVQVILALELWIKKFSPPGVDATLASSWQQGASEDGGEPMNRAQRRAAMRAQGLEPSEQPAPDPYIPFPTITHLLEHALDPAQRGAEPAEAIARSKLRTMAHYFALLADFALDLGDGPDRRTSRKLHKHQVLWLKSLKTIALKARNESSAVKFDPRRRRATATRKKG